MMKTFNGRFVNQFMNNGQEHPFKTEMDIATGDLLVVDCSAGMGVVVVDSIDDLPSPKASRWAFGKIDPRPLDILIERDLRKTAIVKALDAKLHARKETDKYIGLAEADPEAKGLLAELMVLSKPEEKPS